MVMNARLPISASCAMVLAGLLLFPVLGQAQAVPTTPTKFDIKPVTGPTSSAGATISPKSTAPMVRQTTYVALSPLRQWTSSDGKTLMGKLIAWEESVTTTAGTPPPVAQKLLTEKPTVLKDGKARLLIDNKAYELPLARLDGESQKFIQQLHDQLAPAAAKP